MDVINTKPPLISIIIVVYNAEKTLEQAILSIITQTFHHYELIIIDGYSTDDTPLIIERYKQHINYYISENDSGIYDAMHKGIIQAKGEFIYFLGADDILIDDYALANAAGHLLKSNYVYYGNVVFKNRKGLYDGKFNSFKIVTRNICQQAIFYPKIVFEKYRYNLSYPIMADYDLNIRLFFSEKFEFKYMPITIALFNDEGLSGTGGFDTGFEKDRLTIINKHAPFHIYLYRFSRSLLAQFIK